MRSLIWTLGLGVIGAGLVHIAIVLLVPVYADNNAWSRLAGLGPENEFHMVGRTDPSHQVRQFDPLFAMAACRFDLDAGPMHLSATGRVPFWSLSVFSKVGENIYSLNGRTAIDRRLDLVLAQPLQRIELEKTPSPDTADSIVAETDIGKGFVVVRAFIPDESWRPLVTSFLKDAHCAPVGQ
jgi:uncharacterized membrane protein